MKKLHVNVSDEIGTRLDEWVKTANEGFSDGRVTHSDCVEFMLSRGKPDFDLLRRKKTKYGKVLIKIAKNDPTDLDAVIKQLLSYKEITERPDRKNATKGKLESEATK
ncbi:MAG: hypothetical protein JST16_01130 [Bdellovibrionales bacterium]|nr:hypothetical protein [Bdellovibrionales bacterium]